MLFYLCTEFVNGYYENTGSPILVLAFNLIFIPFQYILRVRNLFHRVTVHNRVVVALSFCNYYNPLAVVMKIV